MANTIQLRRSATANAVPTTAQLALGELAINTTDGKLYLKKNVSGTESIVEIGAFASQTAKTFLAAPNGAAGVPSFRAIIAADIPTLNQSTTGNAATATTLQTARTINGTSFDGSANITVADSTKLALTGGTLSGKLNSQGNDSARLFESLNSSASNSVQFYVDHNLSATNIGNARGVLNLVSSGALTIGGSVALTASNYNTYSPTLTGTGASGNWGINVTGSSASTTGNAATATTLQTARTLTIGSTGKTFNGSANVAWTTSEIGAEFQQPLGVPRVNLGDPTVRETALFDYQFNNKTEFYPPANVICETSTNGTTWTTYSVTDAQKKLLVGGDTGASISIPNGTVYFRVRFINKGDYVYLNSLYLYHTSGGHSTKVQIYKKDYGSSTWVQHTSSNDLVGGWPGHIYLPFSTIAYHPSTYVDEVSVVFIPTWNNPTWSGQNITLHHMQIWGGYPAGKRNIYTVDSDKNVVFPGTVTATGITGALTAYSESKVTNAAATGTVTLDLSTSNVFQNTLTGNTTFAFSNPPANTKLFSFTIITVQDATGGRTITWPASKKFAGGVTPPPTTAANAVDVWSVMTYDGGTSYIVSLSVKDAK